MAKNIIARDFSLEDPSEEIFDILIKNGDFHISNDSNQEHVDSIFRAFKGEYRINPELGIGISTKLNGKSNKIQTTRDIREGLALDGFDVTDLEVSFNQDTLSINTNANRKR